MMYAATMTVEFRTADAATVGEHALRQHCQTRFVSGKSKQVVVAQTIDTTTLEAAVTNMRYSVGVILTQEAGFEVNAFKAVAASAEAL